MPTLRLKKGTQVQLVGRYTSPSVSSQGTREGRYTTDIAFKQELFDKKITAVLQIGDVFGTSRREYTSEGVDFYNYSLSDSNSPSISFSLKYLFNNYKDKNGSKNGGDDFESDF